mgnify:CR=1 FL=1
MKMAKKLVAVLLAGVLALSVLTACSGSAGPLTKDNVTDYIIDYYKANGYQVHGVGSTGCTGLCELSDWQE